MIKEAIKKFDGLSKSLSVIAIALILFSLIAPILLTQETKLGIDFTKTGEIGSTIGGIMNPFVAIAGIFVTFLAFYIQFLANERLKDEFKKKQIESQFYEMLKFHKENVNDIVITFFKVEGSESIRKTFQELRGREAFQYLKNELEILYQVKKKVYINEKPDVWIEKAYHTFFYGSESVKEKEESEILKKIQNAINENNQLSFNNILETHKIMGKYFSYEYFKGYHHSLEYYYRYLYQIVKFIVNKEEKEVDNPEKRNYLELLRIQLSIPEQVMLFYYWKSGFGRDWENNNNKFFTDYKIIYNINDEMLIADFKLDEIFAEYKNNDTLFEFQHITRE